ncbi:MAG: hypothetical protein N2258_08095 [Brevinematales bacterium]|nr:hypothetical protein [Brevinematales bacterium]
MKIIGAFLIIISLFFSSLIYQSYKIEKFKKVGVISKARIYKKYKIEKTKKWGNPAIKQSGRYSYIKKSDYYFDIALFIYEKKEGTKDNFLKLPKLKESVFASIPVDKSTYDSLNIGNEIEVVYLKTQPENVISKKMLESLIYINPLIGILILIFLFISGTFLLIKK